jgi:hypothetical protein
VTNVLLEVGQTVGQNFSLRVASSTEVVEVTSSAPVVTSESVTCCVRDRAQEEGQKEEEDLEWR